MNIHTWPLLIHVYKGENRILIIPTIDHKAGYSIESDWYINIKNMEDCVELGTGVIQTVDFIKNSPLSSLTPKEREQSASWKKNSKYKSWLSFWKNNYLAYVKYFLDGHFEICSLQWSEKRRGMYGDTIKKISLPSGLEVEEIGKAVIDIFEASEMYYSNRNRQNVYPSKTIALPDGTNLTIEHPKDRHFTDLEDAHAAEIYQCYSYIPKENAEASAEFFLGMAAELDCSLEMENVRSTWEELYGKQDFFDMQEIERGIFELRFEMKNKDIHKISHFLQIEEDLLLECSMEVHSPNKRKKLDEDLTKLFAEFAGSCRLLTEL